MTFYENFAALCKKKSIKPSRVAEECGINRSNVSNWKKNGYTPRADDLKKIANYFHVPVGYLLQVEEDGEWQVGDYEQRPKLKPIKKQERGCPMDKHFTFEEYAEALQGAGPKLKELILDRAAHDSWIGLQNLKKLVDLAYPDVP